MLEGRFGLFHAFLGAEPGTVDLDAQLADLGSRWETPRIAYKPFPVCHYMHGSLGAAAEATAGRTFAPDEIADVLVTIPPAGVSLVLEPAAQKAAPRSEYEGKFSLQYSTASMLVRGHVGVGDFSDAAIGDRTVLEVARKVRYATREYATYPQSFPGAVRVTLADGSVLEGDLPHQQGGPENPWSADDVRAKFRANAALAVPPEVAAALERSLLALADHDDVRDVATSLRLVPTTGGLDD